MFQKTTIHIVLAMLCLNFTAQAQDNKAIVVTAKGIQIGQQLPDITITNLHNYKDKNGQSATTARISDFKGKLLILDFWATWCSPCVAMIPKMDSLQKQFEGKVQFLSVTYQTEKEVLPFLEKLEKQKDKHYDVPNAIADKELRALFPHVYLPHYVWIDENGLVQAITEAFYINAAEISSLLKANTIQAKVKVDIPNKYNVSKPLFLSNNPDNNNIIKQSTFSKYMEGIGSGFNQNIYSSEKLAKKWFTIRNRPITGIFQAAYQKGIKETILEVKDVSILEHKVKISEDYRDWLRNGNGFCYELLIDSTDADIALQYIRQDLSSFFKEYTASIEKRKVKCLTLVRTSNLDKILTKGGLPKAQATKFGASFTSCFLRVFVDRMKFYLQNHPLPLVDETGFKEMADLNIQANLSNVEELNTALGKYDLKFVEKEAYIDMLIIKDRKQENATL